MSHHAITWTLHNYGRVSGQPTCSAPEGADCRLTGDSPCYCEEWGEIHHDENGRPYHEVETSELEVVRHYMHDMDECNVVLFLDDSDIEECGPGRDVELGAIPIEPVWDGAGYGWAPA